MSDPALAQANSGLSEEQYVAEVDAHISQIAEAKPLSFGELARRCLGVWPSLVAERVAHLKLERAIVSEPERCAITTPYVPELHCGFGEWYFSARCADALAREFIFEPFVFAITRQPHFGPARG
jgi:hypothetical protein